MGAFAQHYYQLFDTNREGLAALFLNESMMTFEGEQSAGTERIMQKLRSLSFTKVKHAITKCDCQPNPFNGGVIVSVLGTMLVNDESNALNFSEIFHLAPHDKSYVIVNNIFRLMVV